MPIPDSAPTAPADLLRRAKARGTHLRWRRQAAALGTCIAILGVSGVFTVVSWPEEDRASVVAAGEGGDDASGTTSTTSSPSTTAPDGGSPGGADDSEPSGGSTTTTTTGRTATSTTTTTAPASASSTTPAPPAADPYPAPRPGRYRYRVSSGMETATTYEEIGRSNGEIRLRERHSSASSPGASSSDGILTWRRDGVLERPVEGCDESPEQQTSRKYVFPLTVGASWSFDVSCSSEGTGEIRKRGSTRVTERKQEVAAGRTFEVWVIRTSARVDITLNGVRQTHYVEGLESFAPALGLPVRYSGQVRQTEAETGAERPPSASELVNVDPE